jgi:hypothetical protein
MNSCEYSAGRSVLICLHSGNSLCRDKLGELRGAVAGELEVMRRVPETCERRRQTRRKKGVVNF